MAEETKVEEKVEEKTEATAAPAEETKAEEVKPNPLQRTIELTISRKELDARVAKALREKAKKAKFHGFRPGHAPAAMVRAAYGQEVQFDAINALVSAAFVEKVQEGKFHVSGYPDIAPTEGAPENEDTMSFTATFEVFPDVEVPDMKDASVTEYECELTDADVERLSMLCANSAPLSKRLTRQLPTATALSLTSREPLTVLLSKAVLLKTTLSLSARAECFLSSKMQFAV